jgi:phosphatidylglycerophosphatase GEP4
MPLNIPGTLVPFQLLWRPRIIVPDLLVKGLCMWYFRERYLTGFRKDIRRLDFAALKRAGYQGAIFDKDNCIVRSPYIPFASIY